MIVRDKQEGIDNMYEINFNLCNNSADDLISSEKKYQLQNSLCPEINDSIQKQQWFRLRNGYQSYSNATTIRTYVTKCQNTAE